MEPRYEPGYFALTSPPRGPLAFVLLAYLVADAFSAAIIDGGASNDVAVTFVA